MLPSTHASPEIYKELVQRVQAATLKVVGHTDLFDEAETRLLNVVLAVYGASRAGFAYSEPSLPSTRIPPPDLVLVHPAVGVVVFECKAYDIGFIYGAEAGSLRIKRHGRETLVNPLRQARRGMFAIKDTYERFAKPGPRPLFHAVVALPHISEHEWVRLGYGQTIEPSMVLFKEQFAEPTRFRLRLEALVEATRQRVGTATPLPPQAEHVLRRVFGDSAVINEARQAVQTLEAGSLGAEIEAMEQAHKSLSPQQEQLSRRNTWGYPFLVRGVAGSGKSIVLANQVARTLYRQRKARLQLSLFEDNNAPAPKIGVVCFNRSLVALLKARIQRAYTALTGEGILPDNLMVTDLNRWLFGISHRSDQFKYISGGRLGRNNQRSRRHLEQLEAFRSDYPQHFDKFCVDALFIDEAQDASPDDFNILRLLVRPNSTTGTRSISIFYDDAQNLYGNPPPSWRELRLDITGGRAVFMDTAYRNTREILELGVNVLLGTHARQRMRVATRRFMDVYTLQEKNLVTETDAGWRVHFAQTSGPGPLVQGFQSRYEQVDWVAESIVALLEKDGVLPEHILVLAPRVTTFQYLSQRLTQLAVQPIPIRPVGGHFQQHIDESLIVPGHLSLSTIHAAKGYDAPIVVLLDTDLMTNNVLGRAQFYVGVTRAKRYLIVAGLDIPNTLMREALATVQALQTQ